MNKPSKHTQVYWGVIASCKRKVGTGKVTNNVIKITLLMLIIKISKAASTTSAYDVLIQPLWFLR